MHAYSPYAAGPLLLHRLVGCNPNPHVIQYPPMHLLRSVIDLLFYFNCSLTQIDFPFHISDTFFITILADFAFTRLVFQRLLFIDLFPDFPGYRLVFLPK
ncbi:hypothetical protein ES288_D05G077400v1 [Gossypium darwinii]|uniref:Uncharacterized protein n=1 Tax=Gossypium darwinii TaxID=34276 RepID=A0A5D2CCY5_GOSDA|nr:hypothetical protein ES288_D05G077400v1 [Gossypium darwinii]